jgi:hypothetical protein
VGHLLLDRDGVACYPWMSPAGSAVGDRPPDQLRGWSEISTNPG